jgi:hypothetical protein
MTLANSLISDSQVFAECKAEIERCCCIEKQLPAQVFRERFNCFFFEEFDWAMSEEFWATLQDLARKSGDQSLLVSVLEPDPVDYYKREFGCYNWAIISSTSTADEYWTLLNHHPEESPADSILSNSERVVWAARSGAWAVWGERALEICVLACSKVNIAESASWHNMDWVLHDILPGCFRYGLVPTEFANQLRKNYS